MVEACECADCGAVLVTDTEQEREPCPKCGSSSRRYSEHCEDSFKVYDQYRIKGKHGGRGKFFIKEVGGANFYFKDQVWNHLVRVIDRENDRYIETITNMSTGKIVRHVDEPLSNHRGHGSAKK